MEVLLEIKENKVEFIMELLRNFSFVKVKPISLYKTQVLEDIKEAVEDMKLVKEGKLKTRPTKELLNEL